MLKKCNLIYSVLKLGMETDIGTWEKLLASFFKYWIGIWLCMSSCFLYALNATEPDQMYKTSYLTYFTLDDEVFIPSVTAWLSPGDLISDLQVTANLPVDMSVFCVCNKIWSKCFLGAGGGVCIHVVYMLSTSPQSTEKTLYMRVFLSVATWNVVFSSSQSLSLIKSVAKVPSPSLKKRFVSTDPGSHHFQQVLRYGFHRPMHGSIISLIFFFLDGQKETWSFGESFLEVQQTSQSNSNEWLA